MLGHPFRTIDEKLGSLFQPDTLTSFQFECTRRKTLLEPEKRLMLAVLEDAIGCFQKYAFAQDEKGRALFREVEEWIRAEDSDWLFAFENICEFLGINPIYLCQGLVEWIGRRATDLRRRSFRNQNTEIFKHERASLIETRRIS